MKLLDKGAVKTIIITAILLHTIHTDIKANILQAVIKLHDFGLWNSNLVQ